jgi:hypothetical protein
MIATDAVVSRANLVIRSRPLFNEGIARSTGEVHMRYGVLCVVCGLVGCGSAPSTTPELVRLRFSEDRGYEKVNWTVLDLPSQRVEADVVIPHEEVFGEQSLLGLDESRTQAPCTYKTTLVSGQVTIVAEINEHRIGKWTHPLSGDLIRDLDRSWEPAPKVGRKLSESVALGATDIHKRLRKALGGNP